MDDNKDLYIKEKLQKDVLISKKADDLFNSFLNGEIDTNEKTEEQSKPAKQKTWMRKVLATAATVLIAFGAVNVYAAVNGYNNIFFMIKDLREKKTVSGKSEILTDQDITISYKPIKISEGLSVQFNELQIKDNKAKLIMRVDQDTTITSDKKINQVKVINASNNSQLVVANFQDEETGSFIKNIDIDFFSNDITTLKIEINGSKENLATLKINLTTKEIEILSDSYTEIEKISEIELKEILTKYSLLNIYNDKTNIYNDKINIVDTTKKEYMDTMLVTIAKDFIDEKYGAKDGNNLPANEYTVERFKKAVKEFAGVELSSTPEEGFYTFPGEKAVCPFCLNITDISYENGTYTVDYQYCYTDEFNDVPENATIYEATLQFTINKDYEYAKYKIVSDIYNLRGKTSKPTTPDTPLVENSFLTTEQSALEYRYSENIKNYKDFNYDLDGDGEIDKITIRKDKTSDENYIYELNNVKFDENCCSSRVYIIDMDKTDNKLEVVIFDFGPSDDPGYTIYEKNGKTMEKVFESYGSNMILDGNGNFKINSTLTYLITPDVYDKLYTLNNRKVTSKDIDIDKEQKYRIIGGCYITKDLKNIEEYHNSPWDDNASYFELLNKYNIYELDTNSTFKINSIIDEYKALITYNGETYYLLSIQGNFAG